MKLVIAGGTGHLGTLLSAAFHAEGHEVVVLSRRPAAAAAPCRVVTWDGETLGPWASEIDGADALVNLCGRSVDCRYGAANRRRILESRLRPTRLLGAAVAAAARPPRVWLQASTATIYAHRYDASNRESDGVIGRAEPGAPETWRFSIEVATSWERAALALPLPHTRLVLMRTAIVMAPGRGGAFDVLLRLVRWGLGGRQGDGRQYVSWIHHRDFVRAVQWLLAHDELAGPVNIAAPHPLPNADFMGALRAAWGTRLGLPATAWMLAAGTFVLRTESELVLKSRRVVPERLTASGFGFEFPCWEEAAVDLCCERSERAHERAAARGEHERGEEDERRPGYRRGDRWWRGPLIGVVAGGAYGAAVRLLAETRFGDFFVVMTLTFLSLVPAIVGYLTVRPHPRPSWLYRLFMPWVSVTLGVIAAALLGLEGTICIVMATPVLLLFASLGGTIAGAARLRRNDVAAVAICLPLALTQLEQRLPAPQAPREVLTSIDVEAPASVVWREIVSVRPIRPEERRPALFTSIGFPEPVAATLDRPGVGGIRQASFTGGLVFVETVTVWRENETLSFSIDPETDAIPPTTLDRHVTIGGPYFDVLDGTYWIEPLPGGRSRLHLASRTRVSTHFNLYAAPWSDAVMRSIQENILEVIRGRAES